jgi:hypothetical protein
VTARWPRLPTESKMRAMGKARSSFFAHKAGVGTATLPLAGGETPERCFRYQIRILVEN